MMARYWINQPSTLQPCHKMHGTLVLAPRVIAKDALAVTVYPTSGPVISLLVPERVLSPGWPAHLQEQRG